MHVVQSREGKLVFGARIHLIAHNQRQPHNSLLLHLVSPHIADKYHLTTLIHRMCVLRSCIPHAWLTPCQALLPLIHRCSNAS
jgi:hypothetical protein